jgi:hypothetical protein
MENKISVRQVCFILIAYNAATKLVMYPTYAAYSCGNALLFPAIFNIILQTAIIWAIAFISSKTDKTFYQLISLSLGEVAAKIIYALFALWFLVSAVLPLSEQQLFVHGVFYETIPSILVFLPFYMFCIYAGSKKFANVGRCADICFLLFAAACALLFIMSISECRFDLLLPVLKGGVNDVAKTSLASITRFSDSAILLMFLGHYKYAKGDAAKITLSYALGGVITLLFMAIFYTIYGPLSAAQPYAIAKIGIFFSAINLLGRIDLFAVYILDIVILFALVINVQMCTYCLKKVFNRDICWVYSLCVNAILIAVCFIFNNNFVGVSNFTYGYLWIAAIIFCYALPLSCFLMRKRYEKVKRKL